MNPSLNRFRDRLLEDLLQFLWRQWSALGIAGYAGDDPPWIIDPEALLLFSLPVAREDPRLFDEILDWLRRNGDWVNVQRLQAVQKEFRLGDPTLLAPVAAKLGEASVHLRWKALAEKTPHAGQGDGHQLFPGIPILGEPDEDFVRWGWLRGKVDLRGMSQTPKPDKPSTFLFKLRALFGRQIRAEVMAWLLTHEFGHPAEIARQTGYFARSVQLVLNELKASGHIRGFRMGREKQFSLNPEDWRFLASWSSAGEFPAWVSWAPLFAALERFYECLAEPGMESRSERFQGIQLREALTDSMPALVRAGIAHQLKATPALGGPELVSALIQDIETILGVHATPGGEA